MAKVVPHPLLSGLSGKSGDLVFRRHGNQIVVAQAAQPSEEPRSTDQIAQQDRFRAAGNYAKQVLADPLQRRAYQALAKARGGRPQLMLIADFLTPPKVEEIDVTGYRGRPGDVLRVLATDDLQVASVMVAIRTAGGELVEAGAAGEVHNVWQYTATTSAPANTALTVTATARDRPGNEATLSIVVPATV